MTLTQLIRKGIRGWHGVKLNEPDWNKQSHSIAFSAELPKPRLLAYFIFNSHWEPLDFELEPVDNGDQHPWRRWIDTALDSPEDIVEWQAAPPVTGRTYPAGPRSVVILWASLSDVASNSS
jgi:glycogen operon protein